MLFIVPSIKNLKTSKQLAATLLAYPSCVSSNAVGSHQEGVILSGPTSLYLLV